MIRGAQPFEGDHFGGHQLGPGAGQSVEGGISIALALSLPAGPARTIVLAATYIVVLFAVIVQGGTVGALIERIKAAEELGRIDARA